MTEQKNDVTEQKDDDAVTEKKDDDAVNAENSGDEQKWTKLMKQCK